ncbi:YggS family pyridoxal phosphate-dependent enzyme [Spirochaetia bacterium 38H-sp]|uniref:Pyridoxal phosphate homeostasis protein n=1 Tax=Rarispira pelagica TaxID=3141764 RepID=A0ABU9UB66_9SPIR
MQDVTDKIRRFTDEVASLAIRAGRSVESVRVMAVTKFHGPWAIEAAYAAGIRVFGESRVQEAIEKRDFFASDVELHLIGNLQRNKAKKAAEIFSSVDSIDRLSVISVLDRYAASLAKRIEIMFEMNVSGEESKHGFSSYDELCEAVELAAGCTSVVPVGLMTMAPYTDDESVIRKTFSGLREIFYRCKRDFPAFDWREISMGMSNDYRIAIEEGSTLLRIGSLFFGDRG